MTKQAKPKQPKQPKIILQTPLFAVVKRIDGSYCVSLASNIEKVIYTGQKDWCIEFANENGSLQ